ncbi:MAG: hypothetical protein SFU25_02595 [Candidatus Caenarcaniphilales bacterium]|nr:hypothetical protein [Candidatus Caenarcaniphilales bacterium]
MTNSPAICIDIYKSIQHEIPVNTQIIKLGFYLLQSDDSISQTFSLRQLNDTKELIVTTKVLGSFLSIVSFNISVKLTIGK